MVQSFTINHRGYHFYVSNKDFMKQWSNIDKTEFHIISAKFISDCILKPFYKFLSVQDRKEWIDIRDKHLLIAKNY